MVDIFEVIAAEKFEDHFSRFDQITIRQGHCGMDLGVVDKGSVGASEVFDDVLSIFTADLCVISGDRVALDVDLGFVGTSDICVSFCLECVAFAEVWAVKNDKASVFGFGEDAGQFADEGDVFLSVVFHRKSSACFAWRQSGCGSVGDVAEVHLSLCKVGWSGKRLMSSVWLLYSNTDFAGVKSVIGILFCVVVSLAECSMALGCVLSTVCV